MENIYTNRLIIFITFFILLLVLTIFNASNKNISYDNITKSKMNTSIIYSRIELKGMKIQMDKDIIQKQVNDFIANIINEAKIGRYYSETQIKLLFANNMNKAVFQCNNIKMQIRGIFFDSVINTEVKLQIKRTYDSNPYNRPTISPSNLVLYDYYCKVGVEWT